ncbi:hypothetical protein DO70_4461 [Burkholderia pseudomallei]|nr:hypothetical protein DO70_4461 [Burkholderia pseudomallei]
MRPHPRRPREAHAVGRRVDLDARVGVDRRVFGQKALEHAAEQIQLARAAERMGAAAQRHALAAQHPLADDPRLGPHVDRFDAVDAAAVGLRARVVAAFAERV